MYLTLTDLRNKLKELKSYVEPYFAYNPAVIEQKFNLIHYGEMMTGSDHAFRDWFKYTFGKSHTECPRNLADKILDWMKAVTSEDLRVKSKTLNELHILGHRKIANWNKVQHAIFFTATLRRTKFAPYLLEWEAITLINKFKTLPDLPTDAPATTAKTIVAIGRGAEQWIHPEWPQLPERAVTVMSAPARDVSELPVVDIKTHTENVLATLWRPSFILCGDDPVECPQRPQKPVMLLQDGGKKTDYRLIADINSLLESVHRDNQYEWLAGRLPHNPIIQKVWAMKQAREGGYSIAISKAWDQEHPRTLEAIKAELKVAYDEITRQRNAKHAADVLYHPGSPRRLGGKSA